MTFLCDSCGKSFANKSNLTRHMASHRETGVEIKCDLCNRNFSRSDVLLRHKKNEHGILPVEREKSFACSLCDKSYPVKKSLTRHLREQHGQTAPLAVPIPEVAVDGALDENQEASGSVVTKPMCICPHCGQGLSKPSNLNRHVASQHPEAYDLDSRIVCPMCELKFTRHSSLAEHLEKAHDYVNAKEELTFTTMAEFLDWKYQMEKGTKSSYVKPRASAFLNEGQRHYYSCHRSGFFTSRGKKNQYYLLQTRKCGFVCPARMTATEKTNGEGIVVEVKVVLYRNHFNHESSIRFLMLTDRERAALREKIKSGATPHNILAQYRHSEIDLLKEDRINVIRIRDIWNTARGYISGVTRAHQNDYLSVGAIVESYAGNPVTNPFIFYKPQDMPCTCGEVSCPLDVSDFMILVMTPYQINVLMQFVQGSNSKVLIDSTHGTTGYQFYLTTLMSMDSCGAGVPLCFCLTNRVDTSVMTKFFRELVKRVGLIKPTTFMSDMDNCYYNAWVVVMGPVPKRLYCTWHVNRSWKKNVKEKVANLERKAEMFHILYTLSYILKAEMFSICLASMMDWMQTQPDLKEFYEYFRDEYSNCPERWAMCYRCEIGLNTNMFLEALHKKLKHYHMDGKKQRRVDECLSKLILYVRDIAYERLTRAVFGNDSSRQAKIDASHKKSVEQFNQSMVTQVIQSDGSESWSVKSANPVYVSRFYTVEKNNDENCLGCDLACLRCLCCIHSFKCSCEDYAIRLNMCKHIHSVARFSGEDSGCDFNELATSRRIEEEMENMRELVDSTPHIALSVELEHKWKTLKTALNYYIDNVPANNSLLEKGSEFLKYMMKGLRDLPGPPTDPMPQTAELPETAEDVDDPVLPSQSVDLGGSLAAVGTPLRQQATPCTTPGSNMIIGSPMTPHNARVTPQRRPGFHSTRKPTTAAKRCLSLSKPTEIEQAEIVRKLLAPISERLSLSPT